MNISDYSYELPSRLIADHPPDVRGTSRLLILDKKNGFIEDKKYTDIVDRLSAGDVLVLNDTKVMRSRIIAEKENGAKRELVILEKHSQNSDWKSHNVMYRGKLRVGNKLRIDNHEIVVEEILGGGIARVSSETNLLDLTKQFGSVPLPPYMSREATEDDIKRYQTVWAKEYGSAAAPTASLNMTNETLIALKNKGVVVKFLTLHVGLGTFLPIRDEKIENHVMHQEFFHIPLDTIAAINKAKSNSKKVVALGTTVARTLEYSYEKIKTTESDITGEADIFIYPEYKFKVVDSLITNFHAPKSTVLMLAAAFAGWSNLKSAYEYAIKHGYRFLSYGDSMMII